MSKIVLALYLLGATSGVFMSGMWAWYGLGGGVILSVMTYRATGAWPRPDRNLSFFLFASLAVMAVLNYHSSQPHISWHLWTSLVTIFLPLTLWSAPELAQRSYHPQLVRYVLFASIASALVLGTELLLGGPFWKFFNHATQAALTDYNRGASYLVMLALPLMAGIRIGALVPEKKQKILAISSFFAVLLYPASLTELRSAKLALMLAVAVIVVAEFRPRIAKIVLATSLLLSTAWPFVAQQVFLRAPECLAHLPPSWRARMEIWDYMSYRIMEKPLLGWGLGSAHTLDFHDPHGANYIFTTVPAAHPHNVVTELWVELGLPGLVLGLIFGFMMLERASRLNAHIRSFAMGAWVAGFCYSLIAFNFWTDSLLSVFALTAFFFAMLDRRLKTP